MLCTKLVCYRLRCSTFRAAVTARIMMIIASLRRCVLFAGRLAAFSVCSRVGPLFLLPQITCLREMENFHGRLYASEENSS